MGSKANQNRIEDSKCSSVVVVHIVGSKFEGHLEAAAYLHKRQTKSSTLAAFYEGRDALIPSSFPSLSTDRGVSSLGFTMMEFPAARAGAISSLQ